MSIRQLVVQSLPTECAQYDQTRGLVQQGHAIPPDTFDMSTPPEGNSDEQNIYKAALIVHRQSVTPQIPYWLQMQSPNAETRSKLYSTGGFTGILLSQIKMADISTTRRLALVDVGFIFLEHGLMVGEVVVLYVKGGGKNGRHTSQSEAFNVAAMSWIGFKVYEHVCGRRFSNIMDTTSHFLTRHFATNPSLARLLV
ncbi:hypothetical protein EYR40_002148 [Pleurotus pulmonarius]|nr:hypothetical protein EYR40_002148 [Pleurotus pulmonarius]